MTILEMREAMKAKLEKARALQADNPGAKWTDDINDDFEDLMDGIKGLQASIDREIDLGGFEDSAGDGITALTPDQIANQTFEVKPKPVYQNIGEQLIDIICPLRAGIVCL